MANFFEDVQPFPTVLLWQEDAAEDQEHAWRAEDLSSLISVPQITKEQQKNCLAFPNVGFSAS